MWEAHCSRLLFRWWPSPTDASDLTLGASRTLNGVALCWKTYWWCSLQFGVGAELQHLFATVILPTEVKVSEAVWPGVMDWAHSGIKVSKQEDVLWLWYPASGGIQVLIEPVLCLLRWAEHWHVDTQEIHLARWGVESQGWYMSWAICWGILSLAAGCSWLWIQCHANMVPQGTSPASRMCSPLCTACLLH